MELSIRRSQSGETSIVRLTGPLTLGPDLLLADEFRHSVAAGRTELVVDLAEVSTIDSAGLATLLFGQAELKRVGGRLQLANLARQHLRSLAIARLQNAFPIASCA